MATLTASAYAQLTKEQKKERKELLKAAKKEAKTLTKDGWKAVPGTLPIEKQLSKSYLMMENEEYIIADAISVGKNYDAAKMQALELAKQNLAGQIQTEITVLIENTIANKQLDPEDAESVIQSISAGKNLITQSIGRVLPIVELYRTLSNRNKEVLVKIAYNTNMAKLAAKKAVKEDLEKKGEDLQQKLDKLLGW